MVSCFSRVRLFVTLWTVAHQAPQAMGFSRQEYWNGLPCRAPGHLPDPGIEPGPPTSPALQADSSLLSHQGKPICIHIHIQYRISHHCGRLRPCPTYIPMACVIPTSWLNSYPLAPADSTVGSHCPLWGKSKVSGNQRHQEHPSVMIKEVVGTWIRPPTRWWRRLRARLNAAQWVDAPMVQSKDAQQDPLCWLPFIVSLPYYLSWNSLPNSTLTSAFGGRETMTAINIHSWIEEVRYYVLPGEHSFSKLF